MKKYLIPFIIFVIATTLALYNINNFPKMVGDEGIYVAQGWWLAHFGKLGPYTYWYDHFPLGWAQIGSWQLLVGPVRFFGHAVLSARVFMGLVLGGTTTVLYLLTSKLTKSVYSSVLSSIIFITSALTLTFGRMVLLDNLAIFWILSSLLILFSNPTKLRSLAFSAILFCLAILSKESLLFFLPPYLLTVYLNNRTNHHKSYAMLVSFTTIFFILSFFPILAILKGELFPHLNQVSFFETILFQSGRGSNIPFWQIGSDFRNMLIVWLSIDPIIIILGAGATAIIPLLFIPSSQKLISLFTMFFFLFLIRGGQIYDFYLIPLLPLFSLNISLAIDYFVNITRTKFLTLIFITSTIIYFVSNALYPLTSLATTTQTEAISKLLELPNNSLIIANNYAYLDFFLQNKNKIEWYSKIESDPPIRQAYLNSSLNKYLLIDETIERESANQDLPLITQELSSSRMITQFGQEYSPGELKTIKPYSSESLKLYQRFAISQTTSKYILALNISDLSQDNLNLLKNFPPFGIIVTKANFNNSTELQAYISTLKENINPSTKIIVMQDDPGDNTIPWVTTPSRLFYKSSEEAKLATAKKTETLKALVFTAAIVSSSSNMDTYLNSILEATSQNLTPILRFDREIPSSNTTILMNNPKDQIILKDASYTGHVLQEIGLKEYLQLSN